MFMVGVTCSPMTTPVVPIRPAFFPAASSTVFIIWVVVVFPLVPVTPIRVSFFAGYPKRAADSRARALRESFTRRIVIFFFSSSSSSQASSSISMGRSVTRILVPAFNTSGIKQWASIRVPVMATNTVPGPAFLES